MRIQVVLGVFFFSSSFLLDLGARTDHLRILDLREKYTRAAFQSNHSIGITGALLFSFIPLLSPAQAQSTTALPSPLAWEDTYWQFMDTFYPSPVPEGIVDTDGDGVSDATELSLGLLPTDPADASLDKDQDRLNFAEELFLGSSDEDVDTDGDTITDWDEVFIHQTDPIAFNAEFATTEEQQEQQEQQEQHLNSNPKCNRS